MPVSFAILLRKNFKYEFRTVLWTLAEVLIIYLFFLLIVINPFDDYDDFQLDDVEIAKTKFYDPITLDKLTITKNLLSPKRKPLRYKLAYTPQNDFTNELINKVNDNLELHGVEGYETESIMVSHFDKRKILAGVVFPPLIEGKKVPDKFNITIRFPSEFRTTKSNDPHENLWITRCSGVLELDEDKEDDYLQNDLYLREGFLQLQHSLFMEWFQMIQKEKSIENKVHKVTARSFRHYTTKEICKIQSGSNVIAFMHYFSFMLTFLNIIWKYARERQNNILAHHWIYGYDYYMHWLAHFIVTFMHLIILDVIILVLVSISWSNDPTMHIMRDINPLYVLLFLLLYNTAMIVTAIVVVTLFVREKNCILFGVAMWLGTYALFCVVLDHSSGLTSALLMSCFVIFFNNGLSYGMRYMLNINEAAYKEEIWILMTVMLLNIFVHLMLIVLIQYFKPGKYIRRSPFRCFGLFKYFECKKRHKSIVRYDGDLTIITLSERLPSWHNFEFGAVSSEEYIKLQNVCAHHPHNQEKQLVKNISMRVYKGEITVILGHRSSGKTTLIQLMAGWRDPDVGWIEYGKQNIHGANWAECRKWVDVCMPNNKLFDLLTIHETLCYFIHIKQEKTDEEIFRLEVSKWLEILRPMKLNMKQFVRNVSFETKRILSLCCTMVCGTKIILLDEPTKHMKAPERRFFQDILHMEKSERAIVLCTHSIDEAECIGDRIAILIDGVLRAYGTQFFLKIKFGVGFDLIIIKEIDQATEPITDFVAKFIPNIVPDNELGDQVTYKLPVEKRAIFQNLLVNIEKESTQLGIRYIRVLGSDLGEVYMSLSMRKNNQVISDYSKRLQITYLDKNARIKQQIYAMLYKKLLHQAPNVIPIISIVLSFLLIFLIGRLARVLEVPPARHNAIHLGLNHTLRSREIINSLERCQFVDIKSVDAGKTVGKVNQQSREFTHDSFSCYRDGNFKDYMKRSKAIRTKFGAVERLENGTHFVCWINQRIFHTAPLALNLLHNMMVEEVFPSDKSIFTTVTNNPMAVPLRTKINLLDQQLSHLTVPLTVGIVVPITLTCFIFPLIEERQHNLMILQAIAGLNSLVYWSITLLWDFLTYTIYMIMYVVAMSFSTFEGFGFINKMMMLLLLVIYGIPALLMTYLIAIIIRPSRVHAFLISVICHLVTGLVSYVFYWDVIENNIYFFYIASVAPTFSLLDGISNIYTESKEREYCDIKCKHTEGCNPENICDTVPQCCYETFFKFGDPGILLSITYMLASAVVFMLILWFLQLHRKQKIFHEPAIIKTMHSATYSYDDPDVIQIRQTISKYENKGFRGKSVVVDQLERHLPNTHGSTLATVSFELTKSVCLAIFGTQHSGKSHLLRQLIGEDKVSFGDVYINGHPLKYELSEVYKYLGYCPQRFGTFKAFTISELLRVFCMIRAVPLSAIPEILRDLAQCLDMTQYMHKKIGTLSVERRRRVNIAISLIIYNSVIILDEPTDGLPGYARREIWNVLRYARFCGKTIIIASTDTVEIEAMADHVMLFDNGEMLAYGSIHYLRNKYSRGFYLEIKLVRDGASAAEAETNLRKDVENLNRFVSFMHAESELISQIDNLFRYYLPVEHITFSILIGALEKNRRRLNISDYTISQATLEDVMRSIAKIRVHTEQFEV